jgi:hypothetical protein
VSHIDIIDVWLKASPAAREHAVDSIGLVAWLDAVPQEWLPQLEQLLTERRQSCIAIVPPEPTQAPDDLSVPEFLRRDCQENDAEVDTNAANLPNESEEEDHDELEPKPKRKLKITEHECSIATAVEDALGGLSELASECRQVVDAAPEGFQQTERIQILAASADTLEDVVHGWTTIPDSLGKIPVTCALPKRRYLSRAARASDAGSMLEACVNVLNQITEEAEGYATARDLISDLQGVIEAVESCEFPGMYR